MPHIIKKKFIQLKFVNNLLIRSYLPNHDYALYMIEENNFLQLNKYKLLLYSYSKKRHCKVYI